MRPLLPFLLLLVAAVPAAAQDFPKLTGRVVDQANIIPDAQEAQLTQKLEALQQASSRQLVVATVSDLQGYPIEDYGYQLGRAWGIGQKGANNGVILLIAPAQRKVRIEVGYGLEPIITDALSSTIIEDQIVPAFKENDYPRGILQGADALIQQLGAPPEEAEQRALAAQQKQQQAQASQSDGGGGGSIFPLLFWGFILFFFILPMLRGGRRGRRHRRGRGGVFIWGPGLGGGWGGGGGSSWGGGGGGGWGGGGGFSGGGGSFGGGGASGGW